jgi:hypothetical protein
MYAMNEDDWRRDGDTLYGPWRQWPDGSWVRDVILPSGLIVTGERLR